MMQKYWGLTLTNLQPNIFSLPVDFDESSEMFTYYNMQIQEADYHFYLRNGNGTCPNGHGGDCSMWSHKQGLDAVKNTCANDNYSDVMLCDKIYLNMLLNLMVLLQHQM